MAKPKIQKKSGYHHGDLRDQLVSAARRLLEEHGPDGFTMADACRLAGVSTAAPYRHFSSKQDLVTEVAKDGLMRLGQEMEQNASKHPRGTAASIAAIGRTYVAFARREPHTFRQMFSTAAHAGRLEDLKQVGQATYGVLLQEVASYTGEKEVTESVIRDSFPLWTHVHGLSFLAIDGKLDMTQIPVNIDDTIQLVVERMLPQKA